MSHKKLGRNDPCPCGSGTKYKNCCYAKGFDWVQDEEGNVGRSLPVSEELREIIDDQQERFVEEFGRKPSAADRLFFDAPPLEHVEHHMVEAMKKAQLDPALIYAFEKTGLLVSEANQHLISDLDLAKWNDAIKEYEARQGNENDTP